MADIFSIIADPTRRQLLAVLRERAAGGGTENGKNGSAAAEQSVSELVARLELSQPTVSKHLKVLRDAGLVVVRDEGQHRYYRLHADPLDEVEDWVRPFLGRSRPDGAQAVAPDRADAAGESPAARIGEGSTWGKRLGRQVAESAHRARIFAARRNGSASA